MAADLQMPAVCLHGSCSQAMLQTLLWPMRRLTRRPAPSRTLLQIQHAEAAQFWKADTTV